MSNIHIVVDGQAYHGWTGFSVNASMKDACRSFDMDIIDVGFDYWGLMSGAACQVMSEHGLLMDGYIDDFMPSLSASQHDVALSGRSKSCDFIDCAAIYEKGGFKDKNILKIGQSLAQPFGLNITCDESLKDIKRFQINQGETAFSALERLAKKEGFLLVGTAAGGIDITKAKSKRQSGSLIEGKNIKTIGCNFSQAKRFSEYQVKGQNKTDSQLKHVETDPQIKRYRPTIIMAGGDMDEGKCKERAKWTMDRAAGEGTRATITVVGMADDNGDLYEPNKLVYTHAPTLKISQDMLIETVNFGKGQQGSLTRLTLVDPRAYGGDAQKTSKSRGGFL